MTPPVFRRYLGIHYAGAETPDSGLKSLRVCSATPATPPQEVLPPPGPRRHWCRRELAHWLAGELAGRLEGVTGNRVLVTVSPDGTIDVIPLLG